MTKIALQDAPGGQQFLQSCINGVADMALAFCGEPDDRVLAHLERGRVRLAARLNKQLGGDIGDKVVDAIISGVMSEKRRLEQTPGIGTA